MSLRVRLLVRVLAVSLSAQSISRVAQAEDPPTLAWLRQYVVPRYATFENVTVSGSRIQVSGVQANATNTDVSVDVVLSYDFSGTLLRTVEVGSSSFYDNINDLGSDNAGNIYLAGITTGVIGGANQGSYDAYLRKINAAGVTLWSRQLGTSAMDGFDAQSLDGLGNLYFAGTTEGNLGGPALGRHDAILGKYDTNGNLQWTRHFGGAGDDYATAVAADHLGNLFVGGATASNLAGITGGLDLFLAKYDASGNQQWLRQYGSAADDRSVRRLAADGLGNVYALEWNNRSTFQSYHLSKYASDGTTLWNRVIGTDENVFNVAGLSVDGTGNVYVGGGTKLSLGSANSGGFDGFVSKYGPSGDAIWTYQLGTNFRDLIHDVWADNEGRVVVVGETDGSFTLPIQDYAVAGWIALLSEPPIPEPSSVALALLALAAVGGTRCLSRRSLRPVH